ncbi:MAG TPA: ABC transporter permease [Candidatus Polarisedimenticolia bacterium]|nr:ABC transporter permease [Candidatus Polarisedimenticolia bacterium]
MSVPRRWWIAAVAAAFAIAPALSPYPPGLQEDVAGARYLPPLTRAHAVATGPRTWILTGLTPTGSGWAGLRAGRRVTLDDQEVTGRPSPRFYLLGTDGLGRDLLSRLLHAARRSLLITVTVVCLALAAAAVAGFSMGWLGGWWDAVLMRVVEGMLCLPRVVVYMVCAAVLSPSTTMLVAVLAATTWPGPARILRAEVMSRRRSDLTMAARALGCSTSRIAVWHILPAMAPLLAVTASLRIADTILLESAVSFLGMGAPEPAVSLGGIIASARDGFPDSSWAVVWPGLAIVGMVAAVRRAATRNPAGREGPSIT